MIPQFYSILASAERIMEIEDVQNVGAMLSSTSTSSLTGGSGSVNRATVYVVAYEDKTMSNEEIAEIIETKTAAEHGISKAMLCKLCKENKIQRINGYFITK